MAGENKDGVSSLRRAGNNRFKDARVLYEKGAGKNLVAACYLAGYTIECWLKVAILKSAGRNHIEELYIEKDNGQKEYILKIHNLEVLYREYQKRSKTATAWYERCRGKKGVMQDWSEVWRYENNIPNNIDDEYTENFLNQVKEFIEIMGNEVY